MSVSKTYRDDVRQEGRSDYGIEESSTRGEDDQKKTRDKRAEGERGGRRKEEEKLVVMRPKCWGDIVRVSKMDGLAFVGV